MELVTGGTGYVGSRLLRRLAAEGRPVRALARRPELLAATSTPCAATSSPATGLEEALEGCSTPTTSCTRWRRRRTATSPAATAGWPRPSARPPRGPAWSGSSTWAGSCRPAGPLSPHLRSRLEVEEILLGAVPGSTALRASIVIGAGSSSFRMLVRLVERLRVLPMPRWRSNRTQPIDERDVIEFLARTPQVPEAAGRSLDVVGPDVMTYGA